VVSRGGPSSIDRDGVFSRQPTGQINSSGTLGEARGFRHHHVRTHPDCWAIATFDPSAARMPP
jgi:hypothetical protein